MTFGNKLALAAAGLALAPAAQANETITYTYDALGRLVAAQHSGTVNNGRADSLCYDAAGNRALYKSSPAGSMTACATQPPPGPLNQPPVAVADTMTALRCAVRTANVIANDTDPENDTPLELIGVGPEWDWAYVEDGVVKMTTPNANGYFPITYIVADALGATATGTLHVTVTGTQFCN